MNRENKIPCSIEILTRNSEATLERCLESVKDFRDIIILDGNSTDRTLEIARRYGARIFKQYDNAEPLVRISDFSEIRNKGLRLAKYDWFMYIDSDEYLSKEAVEEVRAIVLSQDPPAHAFWQPRKYVLDEKIIECATTYPNQQIRFFHRGYVEGFIKPIHERIALKSGVKIGWLGGLEFVPVEPAEQLRERWRRYTVAEEKMVAGASRAKLLRLAVRHIVLFLLYTLRYIRNLFFCKGARMPLRREFWHNYYIVVLAFRLFKKFAGKSFFPR